jgi:NAD(P)-dependent dehydrogenase (short-subunit alcohol dehydrogenase family)
MHKSRAVLITGCSSGIGHRLAQGLKARGYRVIATARKPEDAERLDREGLEGLHLDLRDSESIRSAVATVLERTGGNVYGLVNNGAYGQPGAVEDLSREVLRQQFETNLFGTQELTNAILPAMRARNEGRIVQISSILGIVTFAYRGAYNASKFALEALSDTMRLELRGSGIHVSLVEPGPIVSRFRDNALAAFRENIDVEHSIHRDLYRAVLKRLEGRAGRTPFTLPPEAVLKRVIHALEAPRPKIRYPVTTPTYVFGYLRRLLPAGWLDRIVYTAGDRPDDKPG